MRVETLLLMLTIATSLAAAPDPEVRRDTLDEIVVTAERITDAAQSPSRQVSRIYLDRIEGEQRRAIKELSNLVPNLYIPDYGSRMTSSIYVRGLGARIDNPVLGITVDGIAIGNKNSYDFEFSDIVKVEIYRGPQGTLFGRNTIGGVVAISTLSPRIFEGIRASVGYGNGTSGQARVGYYRMVNNSLGIAANITANHSNGFYINRFDNSHADLINEAGARLRLDYSFDSLSIINTLSYNYTNQNGFPYHQAGREIEHNDINAYLRHNLIEGLNITRTYPHFTLNAITTYQMLLDRMSQDQDFTARSFFNMQQAQQEHLAGQELTFRSKRTTKLWSWISGISATYKHNRMNAPVNFLSEGIDELILKNANQGIHNAFPDDNLMFEEEHFTVNSLFRIQNVDAAIFHTSYFKLKDWQIELGLRLNYEHQSMAYNSNALIHYLFTGTMNTYRPFETRVKGKVGQDYVEVMPRVAVSYERPTWAIYASASEGYKGGGFNTQLFSDIIRNAMMTGLMADLGVYFDEQTERPIDEIITYKPERCMNIELGARYHESFGDWRLQGDATLYWIEIINQQLTVFPENTAGRMMTNAGRSRSIGAELTANITWQNLNLNLNYGYTNARFVHYNDGREDYKGRYLPYVPQHTIAASLSYRLPLKHKFFYALRFNVNTSANGPIYWNEANTLKQPIYALLNANIALEMKYFTLELWGKNLTNTRYDLFYFESLGRQFYQSARPAQLGIKINFQIERKK